MCLTSSPQLNENTQDSSTRVETPQTAFFPSCKACSHPILTRFALGLSRVSTRPPRMSSSCSRLVQRPYHTSCLRCSRCHLCLDDDGTRCWANRIYGILCEACHKSWVTLGNLMRRYPYICLELLAGRFHTPVAICLLLPITLTETLATNIYCFPYIKRSRFHLNLFFFNGSPQLRWNGVSVYLLLKGWTLKDFKCIDGDLGERECGHNERSACRAGVWRESPASRRS